MDSRSRKFDWASFLLGVLFILLSLLSFQNPAGNLISLVLVFAIFAIIKGVFYIFIRNKVSSLTGYKAYVPIIIGVFDIIVGVYLLFNLNVGLSLLPFVFSIWFIADSVLSLFTLDLAKAAGTGYFIFSLIIDLLGILVGVMMLFDPITAALTLSFLVGWYFMMFGILEIVYSFR